MNLLLDQGLPRSAEDGFRAAGWQAVHASSVGLAEAGDGDILRYARQRDMVVVTLDADFHALLALSGETRPSVIRIRVEGLRGDDLVALLVPVLRRCRKHLQGGALVTVGERRIAVRSLPLLRGR